MRFGPNSHNALSRARARAILIKKMFSKRGGEVATNRGMYVRINTCMRVYMNIYVYIDILYIYRRRRGVGRQSKALKGVGS